MKRCQKYLKCAFPLFVTVSLIACNSKHSKPVDKENEITGLLEHYNVDCGSNFEAFKSAITSISSDLSYTYYLDQDLVNKYYDIDFDGFCASLDGGTTKDYWVKVTAGGIGTGYKEVSEVAKVTARCVENDTPNIPKDVIGYKTISCKGCKTQLGSGSLMETEDIVLADTTGDVSFNYGLKTGFYVTEIPLDPETQEPTEPYQIGDIRYGMFENENKPSFFYLPKINYRAFRDRNILIRYRSNNRPGWGDKYAIHFGLDEDATNLFDGTKENNWNINPNGLLLLNYDSTTQKISIKNIGNVVTEAFIDDESIINGVNPIKIYAKGSDRSICLFEGCVTLDHTHNWGDHEVSGTERIGHKVKKCDVCGYSETSASLMGNNDINLNNASAYGANGTGTTNGKDDDNRGKSGGIKWYYENGTATDYNINFPKVDFTAYSSVIFEFGSSSAAWAGENFIRLSINERNDLLNLENSVGIYGCIEARYNAKDSKLDLVSRTSVGDIKTVSVSDTNIINGIDSLHGTLTLGNCRAFYLNRITVNHDEHSLSDQTVASTIRIGHKITFCEVCLIERESEEVMTDSDISLSVGSCYGGNPGFNTSGGDEGNRGKTGGVGWQAAGEKDILFPRVDYRVYTNVIFEFGTSTGVYANWGVGLTINEEKDLLDIPNGVSGVYGCIEAICNSDNELVLTSRTSTGLVKSVVVTDENVINGTSSLSGTLDLGEWRSFYLNEIIVNHSEHEAESSTKASKTVIGYKTSLCKACLYEYESTEKMTNSDIDLSKGYGAHSEGVAGFLPFNGTRMILGNGGTSASTPADQLAGTVYLPRVNYSIYSEVKFNLGENNLWGKIGFSETNSFGGFGDSDADRSIVLTVTNVGGVYNATLVMAARSLSVEMQITDEDIINGTNSLTLYLSLGGYSEVSLYSVTVA